jgi:hypothetical protein
MAMGENVVFVLFTVSGTETGPFMGMAPSNRTFSCHVVDFFRYQQGKMIEGWVIGKGDVMLALQALHADQPNSLSQSKLM